VRSPSFYGLINQRLEAELGGVFSFVEGASGSTHNLNLSCAEATDRIASEVKTSLSKSQRRPMGRLASLKRPFTYKVRTFDEETEDATVTACCKKWVGESAANIPPVFKQMRRQLAGIQDEQRGFWIQAMFIGEVAIVGIPAEFFTKLGLDIKNRPPYRYTYIAELANDWIGYLPDKEAHKLGGYQVRTGFHSFAEHGTGERVVDETVALLKELEASE
jgi:neutral ceramidase